MVLRKSGYMNSGAETETELASNASLKRNRRRQRSRSRSPGESRARLPAEILQHLEFGLVEPNAESLRGEIPFTNVETNTTSSSASRHYHQRPRPPLPPNQGHLRTATTRSVVSAIEPSADPNRHRRNSNGSASVASASAARRSRPMQHNGTASQPTDQFSGNVPSIETSMAGFVWPVSSAPSSSGVPNYGHQQYQGSNNNVVVATSTPVSSGSSRPYYSPSYPQQQQQQQQQQQSHNNNFHSVGLPVATTQYQSIYAPPQSSSGSNGSMTKLDNGLPLPPPPPPPPASTKPYQQQQPPQMSQQMAVAMRMHQAAQGHKYALPPTVLTQQQHSPHYRMNNSSPSPQFVNGQLQQRFGSGEQLVAKMNHNNQSPSLHQGYRKQVKAGFEMPSGDEMSTEL